MPWLLPPFKSLLKLPTRKVIFRVYFCDVDMGHESRLTDSFHAIRGECSRLWSVGAGAGLVLVA